MNEHFFKQKFVTCIWKAFWSLCSNLLNSTIKPFVCLFCFVSFFWTESHLVALSGPGTH